MLHSTASLNFALKLMLRVGSVMLDLLLHKPVQMVALVIVLSLSAVT